MVEEIALQYNTIIPKIHAPLFMFLAAAYVVEGICRPIGIQPPLHRRRIDFFRKSFYFSQDNALTKLGFKPKTEFVEGVKKTADWYKTMGLL
jgi:nucleoside-diphosphate-sugar epimerase